MELLITFLVGLALMEIYAWLPRVCEWIVGLAIRLLPPEHRERWREEFQESQSALPQSAWRLAHAISLCWGALSMRHSLAIADVEEQLERVDETMASFLSQHQTREAKLVDIASAIASRRSQIVTLQAQVQLQLQPLSGQNAQTVACRAALGDFAETLFKAHGRSTNILAAQTDNVCKALNDASPLVKRVGRNWKFTRRVWPIARKVPILGPVVFTCAVSVVLRESERLISCLDGDSVVDRKSLEEAHNIGLAIRQAAGNLSALSVVDHNSVARLPAQLSAMRIPATFCTGSRL